MHNRAPHEIQLPIRRARLIYDLYGYADASVLLEIGHTKVLCSITLILGVPSFLRGKGIGWLTAEYSMLPTATHRRTFREATQNQRNSRSVEISRLIGRSLRSVMDLNQFGEKTIHIDCDVVQADGGTRVASITAASYALKLAIKRWKSLGLIDKEIMRDDVAAISVGIVGDDVHLDLNAQKDMQAQVDFNFVLARSGKIIEIQGTAEKEPFSWEQFDELKEKALVGVQSLFAQCDEAEFKVDHKRILHAIRQRIGFSLQQTRQPKNHKAPFFSLANR